MRKFLVSLGSKAASVLRPTFLSAGLLIIPAGNTGCTHYVTGEKLHDGTDPTPTPDTANLILHGDIDFSETERYEIYKATETWNLQTAGQAHVEVSYDLNFNDETVVATAKEAGWNTLIRLTQEEADADKDTPPGVAGWATSGGIHSGSPVTIVIVADTSMQMGWMELVVLHEVGHGLGLRHLEDRSAVMFPTLQIGKHECLSRPDLQEFCRLNKCEKPTYPCVR